MTDTIDHKALAESRLALQFTESTKFIGYIKALINEGSDLESVFQDILKGRFIAAAVGVQLDILGAIVGQSRVITDGYFIPYFGFVGQPNATGFNGAPFFSIGDPAVGAGTLDDDTYRLYIKAKIALNHSRGVHEDFVTSFKLLFGDSTKVLTEDAGNANSNITIFQILSATDIQLIRTARINKILPMAAGIQYNFYNVSGDGYMGFAGNPLATGFNRGGFLSLIGV